MSQLLTDKIRDKMAAYKKTGRKYLYHVQNVSRYPEQIPLRKGITSVFGSYGYYKG